MILISKFKNDFIEIINNFEKNLINLESIDAMIEHAKKVFIEHQNAKKIYEDCLNDLRADLYGLQKAKEHGYCSDKVKDVGKIFKK